MSWSISLSGPVDFVKKELADARRVLEAAEAYLFAHKVDADNTVGLNAFGSAALDSATGKVTSATTGHSITVTPKPESQLAAQPEATATLEAAPAAL